MKIRKLKHDIESLMRSLDIPLSIKLDIIPALEERTGVTHSVQEISAYMKKLNVKRVFDEFGTAKFVLAEYSD